MGRKLVLQDPVITIDGVDFSDQFYEASVTFQRDDVESTNFGAKAKGHEKGLFDNGGSHGHRPDRDMAKWRTLLGHVRSDDTVSYAIKQKNEAVSASNPEMRGDVHFFGGLPFAGGQGSLVEGSIDYKVDGAWTVAYDDAGTDTDVLG